MQQTDERRRLLVALARPIDFQYRIIHIVAHRSGMQMGLNIKDREDRVLVSKREKNCISQSGAFEVGDRIMDVSGTPVNCERRVPQLIHLAGRADTKAVIRPFLKGYRSFTVLIEHPKTIVSKLEVGADGNR